MGGQDRIEAFNKRREGLKGLSDEQLKNKFWELCNKAVEPMVEFAKSHTSPSIERAVLLRMGVDSISAHGVVERINEAGLLGKGAGHVLLKLSQRMKTDTRGAAKAVLADKKSLDGLFS
ncbi:MAG: D-ornithine 4,5-aminomutase subunit OraS [Candidatus Ozemobacteraceae bacterium]